MPKLIILSGIPGSGKSYRARQLALYAPKTTVIVSRDSIREGLGQYWVPSRENLVTDIENNMIDISLTAGYDVVLDATNLNPAFLDRLYKRVCNLRESGVDVTMIKMPIECSLTKAVIRDYIRGIKRFFGSRERKVGYKVIKHFYDRYYKTK